MLQKQADMAQAVAHLIGSEEVPGPSPGVSSKPRSKQICWLRGFCIGCGSFAYVDFFFYHDKMYYWTQRKDVENYLKIEDFELYGPLVELLAFKDIKIIPVLFAGVYTGYRDDRGKKIFTGDVVKATTLMNTNLYTFIAGINNLGEANDDYYYVLDNCPIPMRYTNKVVVIGNVFYDLDRDDMRVDIGGRCAMLACPYRINLRNLRIKMAHAPYFKCKTWQDAALKVLMDEPRYDNLPIYIDEQCRKTMQH